MLRGATAWQLSSVVKGRTKVRNFDAREVAAILDDLLNRNGAREYHLLTANGDLHLRITRKGRALLSRSKAKMAHAVVPRAHDRQKRQPLDTFDATPLLRVLGMGDGEGRIHASMRAKATQVNAFLREIDALLPPSATAERGDAPLTIVDCGAGRAYLTLAAYSYLSQTRHCSVKIYGIERNSELVSKANKMAADLDAATDVRFIEDDLASCKLELKPDLLLSLHACDTATDQALARGVEWGVPALLAAPCCQHDLRPANMAADGALRALLRHGILRERLADLLTDASRAQVLRMLGYRVNIVEFVEPEATARNLMLRASLTTRPAQAAVVEEYRALRALCEAPPAIERILSERLRTLGLSFDAAL